jgi:hypothetical protein
MRDKVGSGGSGEYDGRAKRFTVKRVREVGARAGSGGGNTPKQIKKIEDDFEEFLNSDGIDMEMDRATEGSLTKQQLVKNTEANIEKTIWNFNVYLTGSRAWKQHSASSDHDYFCKPDTYESILKEFQDKNVTYHDHPAYKALYVMDIRGTYNIICVSPFDWECWKFATKAMVGMWRNEAFTEEMFKDKDKVYGAFEMLRNMYRFVGMREDF